MMKGDDRFRVRASSGGELGISDSSDKWNDLSWKG
jgi:hypothetical protein